MGDHSTSSKPQPKVVAATGGSVVGSGVALLALADGLPQWGQVLVILLGPPIMTFVTGYLTKQTPRP